VQNLLYESDRRIQVEWSPLPDEPGKLKQATFPVRLTVICDDRAGMLKELTAIISEDGTNIRSMESKEIEDGMAAVEFVVETVDVRHLNKLVQNMKKVTGVREVQRAQKI
jgi:GTP pyrophosphokinase